MQLFWKLAVRFLEQETIEQKTITNHLKFQSLQTY